MAHQFTVVTVSTYSYVLVNITNFDYSFKFTQHNCSFSYINNNEGSYGDPCLTPQP